MEELGEIRWQGFLQYFLCREGLVDDFLQSFLCKRGGYSRSFGSLDEMPAANSVHHIMTIGSHNHRKAHLFLVNLRCGQTRLSGKDIVERSQAEATEWPQKDAEVFSVAVRGTDQTKDNLCLEKPRFFLMPLAPRPRGEIAKRPRNRGRCATVGCRRRFPRHRLFRKRGGAGPRNQAAGFQKTPRRRAL